MNHTPSPPADPSPPSPPAVAVIACAVLEAEVAAAVRDVPHVVHVEMLEQGLHNEPDRLRAALQEAVFRVEALPRVEAIALGYGLCSRGLEGIHARRCRLVVTRAHDCITLLLGDRRRYDQYVAEHPGTYWYSPGWNKHHTPPGPDRYRTMRDRYVAQYGEDNADFLMETEQAWYKTYHRATYVDLTVGVTEQDLAYTRRCADWLGWSFDHQRGDPRLLRDLVAGPWDDARFLVLAPGQTLRLTADDRVIEAVALSPDAR